MTLADIARSKLELVTAEPSTPVSKLAQTMKDRKVGSVVIERRGIPEGIVTDRDIAVKVVAEGESTDLTAADVMTEDVVTADVEDGVFELCARMSDHGVRRMPIVEDGRLSGIVTLDDLIVLFEGELHELARVIEAESPQYSG